MASAEALAKEQIAERGFDPRTFGLGAQHANHCATPLHLEHAQFISGSSTIAGHSLVEGAGPRLDVGTKAYNPQSCWLHEAVSRSDRRKSKIDQLLVGCEA